MPKGNYKSVSIREEIIDHVKNLIDRVKTYHSVAEFVSEALRLRIELLEKQEKRKGEEA